MDKPKGLIEVRALNAKLALTKERWCGKCESIKSLDDYYKGVKSYCKDCYRAANREWYVKNKDRRREYNTQGGRTITAVTDTPTYGTVHRRLAVERGNASNYDCTTPTCNNKARDWAFRNNCDEAMTNGKQLYCPHPEHYNPYCRSCHFVRDGVGRKA